MLDIYTIIIILTHRYNGCRECGTYDTYYARRRLALGRDYACPCCGS